ncbi:ryncolin-4-like [Musca autumnalis]|uniref:ryncolin-4-like n=1 Tax=Musca autumnalis TaxID=221902 RepID=UPI003CE76712
MKTIFKIFLLKIIFASIEAADNATSEELYNPHEDEHVLWRKLFIKVNTLLLEMDKRQHEQGRQMNVLLKQIEAMRSEFRNVQHEQERQMNILKQMNVLLKQIEAMSSEFRNVQHEQERQMNILKQMNADFLNVLLKQGKQLKKIVKHTEEVDGVNRFDMIANNRSMWTTILRRMDGSVNFFRSWAKYKTGFGNPPSGEFFIGLDKLHLLTTAAPVVELKILLKSWDNEERYVIYDGFQIGNETEKYRIKLLGKYNGDAGDKLRGHAGLNFTTYDEDNDMYDEGNCARDWKGAWWFRKCYDSHLFGPYRQKENANTKGIVWYNSEWKGADYSFKYAEMLLRPKIEKL